MYHEFNMGNDRYRVAYSGNGCGFRVACGSNRYPGGAAMTDDLKYLDKKIIKFLHEQDEYVREKVVEHFKARIVKTWRVDLGASWEKIAELYYDLFPDDNQVGGRVLCDKAQKILGEDWENDKF